MTGLESLREARKKIEKSENWCREAFARTAEGKEVTADSPEARQWCLLGAIAAVREVPCFFDSISNYPWMYALRDATGCSSIGQFNDDPKTTHEKVLEVIDQTIAELEKQESQ
jgi:hypothetical protein